MVEAVGEELKILMRPGNVHTVIRLAIRDCWDLHGRPTGNARNAHSATSETIAPNTDY